MSSHWTINEIKFLREHFPTCSHNALSKIMNRSIKSIKRKCSALKLIRPIDRRPSLKSINAIQPTDLEKAYFAGHFDGEGCVMMPQSGLGCKVVISAVGGHKPTIESYRQHFGGSIRKFAGKNKCLWHWQVFHQKDCALFIESILPFAKEKKEQLLITQSYLNKRLLESCSHPSSHTRELGRISAIELKKAKGFNFKL